MMPRILIELPSTFTPAYEQAVLAYLADQARDRGTWALLFQAFDMLDHAVVVVDGVRNTFRRVYQQYVDLRYADRYIDELLALRDVARESPAVWARFARQIVQDIRQRGWRPPNYPAARMLVSYLLYWWNAFARGYALEVEVFRDLEQNGIRFTAHDLRDRQQRYSLSDLVVQGLSGDVKTSVYFVQAAVPLAHDFYIVRLSTPNRTYTLTVMLQPLAWDTINGDTVAGDLTTLVQQLASPVRISHAGHTLVVLDYAEWKRRILRLQGDEQ